MTDLRRSHQLRQSFPPNHNVKGAHVLSPGPTPLKESIDGGVYVAVMLEVIELFQKDLSAFRLGDVVLS